MEELPEHEKVKIKARLKYNHLRGTGADIPEWSSLTPLEQSQWTILYAKQETAMNNHLNRLRWDFQKRNKKA